MGGFALKSGGRRMYTANSNSDAGYLVVQVSAASREIPIAGAQVVLTSPGDGAVIRIMETDRSGRTETIGLPAPPRGNSMHPDGSVNYSIYNIRTDKEGYYSVENIDVPVFGGQVTVQQVALIPLPLGSMGRTEVFRDIEPDI